MPLTGYLKIPDIDGESQATNHEDEIEIHGIEWGVSQKTKTSVARGRTRGKTLVSPLEVQKFYDASSPYIALAAMQGKSFKEIVLKIHRDGGAHLDYLVITMSNCVICDYHMANDGLDEPQIQIREWVGISFETIRVLYTEQADDHTPGDEHEIEYDIIAGA